jgi:hypothetical protein
MLNSQKNNASLAATWSAFGHKSDYSPPRAQAVGIVIVVVPVGKSSCVVVVAVMARRVDTGGGVLHMKMCVHFPISGCPQKRPSTRGC